MITPLLVNNSIFNEDDFIYDNIRGLANPCIKHIYTDLAWDEIAEALDKYYVYNTISLMLRLSLV